MTDERDRLKQALREATARASSARRSYAAKARARRAGEAISKEALARAAAEKREAERALAAASRDAAIADKTGTGLGIVAVEGGAEGVVAIALAPGISSEERDRLVGEALGSPLDAVARELGVILAAAPSRFARERPGRDAAGRTVFDVAGRVEGDVLVPAVRSARRT